MKISMINLKKCLGVKELEFKPGQITLIEGAEGQGKTSILESIQRLFYNKSERPKFVKSDEDRAEMYLMLDDGTAIKKYINSENKVTSVSVEKDGMQAKGAESFLKGLVSERQLNPISLIEMQDKELTELILSLIPIKVTEEDLIDWVWESPLGINLDRHGLQVCKEVEKYFYDLRTEVNRDIKNLTAEIKALSEKLPDGYNVEEWRNVSLTEKYEAISKANKVNSDRQKHQAITDNLDSKIEALRSKCKGEIAEIRQQNAEGKQSTIDKIVELKRQIELLEKDLEQADGICELKLTELTNKYKVLSDDANLEVVSARKFLEENKEIDITPLELDHKQAEEMKSYIRSADDLKEKEATLADKQKRAETLKDKIEFMRTKPQMLLAKAKMPIEGLTVDSQGNVLINERPIINLSGGERIKFVMNIVRATAGELKIILIDGFEKLSPSSQKAFIDECAGDGYQYMITKVTDGALNITSIKEDGTAINAETGELLAI